ncbi:MAG: AI-2E family transporter [Ktedonobacterales bacterium]
MDTVAPHPDQVAVISETPAARRRITITITTRTMWVAALIVLAILAAVFLITKALGPVTLLVLSIILGEAIRPLVARLKRYHIPGPLAVLLIYLVVLLIVGVLFWLLLNPLLSEVSAFSRDLPQYLTQLQDDVHRLERSLRTQGSVNSVLDTLSQSLATLLQNSIPALLVVPFNVLSGLFTLFIDLVIVLTMTLFWLMSSAKLNSFVVGLFPAQSQEQASLVISEIGKGFGGYVRGLLISMVLIGLMAGLGLTILGIPYALLLGVLAGFTSLIPYIGPWISGPIAVVVALIAVDPAKALEVIILFFLIFMVEGEVVQPLVMSQSVRVDPLVVIVSVLIGLTLLGVIGAILAVPIAAGIQVLVVRVLTPALRRASNQTEQSSPAVARNMPVSGVESP